MSDIKKRTHKNIMLIVMAVFLILGVLWAYVRQFGMDASSSQEVWGQFGDYFGGILNPLLSFVALVVLLYNVTLQMQASKEAEERHDSQTFDSRFFQLLTLNTSLVPGIQLARNKLGNSLVHIGHDALGFVAFEWVDVYLRRISWQTDDSPLFQQLLNQYAEWADRFWVATSSYFSSAILVIDFIHAQAKSEENASFAISALKAQLNPHERMMLFYVMLNNKRTCLLLPFMMIHGFWDENSNDQLFAQYAELVAEGLTREY